MRIDQLKPQIEYPYSVLKECLQEIFPDRKFSDFWFFYNEKKGFIRARRQGTNKRRIFNKEEILEIIDKIRKGKRKNP